MGRIRSAIKGAEELVAHLTSPEDQDVAKKASQRLHSLKAELQALEVASRILSRRQEESGGVDEGRHQTAERTVSQVPPNLQGDADVTND